MLSLRAEQHIRRSQHETVRSSMGNIQPSIRSFVVLIWVQQQHSVGRYTLLNEVRSFDHDCRKLLLTTVVLQLFVRTVAKRLRI